MCITSKTIRGHIIFGLICDPCREQFQRGHLKLPSQKVRREEDITEDVVANTLRKALRFYSTLQAEDGQWPGDYGGLLFLLPGLVISLWVMGVVDAVLPNEHQKEICRYAYNHQLGFL
ncbi:hypothetical protein RJ639_047148 [Escallonia herrerae]|uniref:Squalene cyclase N-terminal domain-containing protein n=1 Tax=Escallonia herrerae TaxID=1293975 RepID=A0AA88W8D0_9ASTE|nr:hypothetical protein RJ639_047148 [Escallonia herrerae]